MTSFIIQIVIMSGVLSLIVIILTKKKTTRTPYEITYKYQLIEKAVYCSPNAIIITDVLNIILIWNTGAEKLFGYKESEVKGKDLRLIEIILPEVVLLDTPMDTQAMHRLQSLIPISLTVSESKVGDVSHYTAIMKSIRDRKEKEAVAARELLLLNEAEEIGGYGSWSWDVATNLVMVTDGFNRIFETDDLVTDVEYLMKKVYYLDRESVQKILSKALEEKKDYVVKYRLQKLDGELIWLKVIGKMFLRKNGTLEKVVGTIKEINDVSN